MPIVIGGLHKAITGFHLKENGLGDEEIVHAILFAIPSFPRGVGDRLLDAEMGGEIFRDFRLSRSGSANKDNHRIDYKAKIAFRKAKWIEGKRESSFRLR